MFSITPSKSTTSREIVHPLNLSDTTMPPPTNISPLLPKPEINNSHQSEYHYVDDSDNDEISKSFICSSLHIRKKKPQQPNKHNNAKQQQQRIILSNRMNVLSKYASDHNKTIDPSILDLTHRNELENPEMLRYGITPEVASQILELRVHNSTIEEGCGWPYFLDVISTLLLNLKHVQCWYPDEVKPPYNDCVTFEQKRMLRLYILYRLPDLQSINEEYVTEEERRLARPCTPLGVQVNREDWCTGSMIGYMNNDVCSITDSTSDTTFHDDIQDEIGVEVIATTNDSYEEEDEEIMQMVQNVLVEDMLHLENNDILKDDPSIEKECSYVSFRSNVISPSPTYKRPPKHPSRRRCYSSSLRRNVSTSFSIIDQSSDDDDDSSSTDDYWI